eukprot:Skav202737  [mRNA]  locus=scaffold1326:320543:322425:- [translate_table: standard]
MRERHECHCMLFLKDDNPFAQLGGRNVENEEEMRSKSGESEKQMKKKEENMKQAPALRWDRLVNEGIYRPLKLEAAVHCISTSSHSCLLRAVWLEVLRKFFGGSLQCQVWKMSCQAAVLRNRELDTATWMAKSMRRT